MGIKFNPPPGWPLPYNFEPPAGWEPDPQWPPAPADWPLWIGSDAPPAPVQAGPGVGYVPGYLREPAGAGQAGPVPGWPAPAPAYGYGSPSGRKRPSRRKRVVTTLCALLAISVSLAIGHATLAHRSSRTGRITTKGQLDVFSLRVGDCFLQSAQQLSTGGFTNVTAIPCSSAHNAQVFARFPAVASVEYPGRPQLELDANDGCRTRVVKRLDKSKFTRKLARATTVQYVIPLEGAWADGHRAISCVIDLPRKLTISLVKRSRSR